MHIMIVWHEKEDCRIPSIMWFGFPPMMILCDLTNKLYVLKLNQYVYWKFSWYTDEIFVCIWGCFACIYLLSAFSICVLMSWILPLCSHICIVYIVDVCGLCSKYITYIDDSFLWYDNFLVSTQCIYIDIDIFAYASWLV